MIEFKSKVFSVSELTAEIKEQLEYNFENVCVSGEISNFVKATSGHFYFTLKDEGAQIRAVMFRQSSLYMRFVPKDGMQILAKGRVSVYEPRGAYQIILDYIEPAGIGALKQAFEDLKKKLDLEGLFSAEKKKPLPELLKTIGVVTSPTGAAIRDFLSVLNRRSSKLRIIIYPAMVQGDTAAKEISEGIEYFNDREFDGEKVDAIVITRGGGSFEDLFCFSQEIVARSVYASKIPVISAVGHEIDYSISDFVADLRAPTPSIAAELLVYREEETARAVEGNIDRLNDLIGSLLAQSRQEVDNCIRILSPQYRIDDLRLRIDELTSHLVTLARGTIGNYRAQTNIYREILKRTSPEMVFAHSRERVDSLIRELQSAARVRGKSEQYQLDTLMERLDLANPYNILKKGYSVVTKKDTKSIVKKTGDVLSGEILDVRLGEGNIECEVTKVFEN